MDLHDRTFVQCLVFALDNSSESFVLIPSTAVKEHSNVCQLFTQNNIKILTSDEEYPVLQEALEHDQVEVVELLAMSSAYDQFCETKYAYPSATTPFMPIAVHAGNEKLVTQLFSKNAAVYDYADYFNGRVDSFKRICIDDGNAEIIDRLLSIRADIRYKNPLGGTILHLAVRREIEFLVQLLLKHGVNVDAVCNDGSTALHLAVQGWRPSTIPSLLVETGKAAVNARREDGSTSLLLAVKKEHSDVVSLLLRNKADVNIGDSDGYTPLHAAARLYDQTVLEELLEHGANIDAPVSYCYAKGVTPLYVAVEAGCLPAVKCLLEKGANPSLPCYDNQTVLQLAVDLGWDVEIVECILRHLPDCNNRSVKKLLCKDALRNNKTWNQIVQLLLEHGFSIDVKERDETELLLDAIAEYDDTAVKRLLESGADVNKVCRFNNGRYAAERSTMPLFRAIECRANDIVKLLINHGADINAKLHFYDEKTPLLIAVFTGNAQAAMILLAQNVKVSDDSIFIELLYLIHVGYSPEWEDVLLRRMNMNLSLSKLLSTFMGSRSNNVEFQFKIIEVLMNFGAIDIRDFNGETALHLACRNGVDPQVVKYLVQNCADVDAQNLKGETPFLVADEVVGGHTPSNVRELLQYGARINTTDRSSDLSQIFINLCLDKFEIFEYLLQFNFSDIEFFQKINVNQLFSENSSDIYEHLLFISSRREFAKSAETLAKHMVQLKVAFPCKEEVLSFCSEDNLRSVSVFADDMPCHKDYRCQYWLDFQHQCEAEMTRLKNHRIGDSCVSYYDILTKNEQSMSCYFKNPIILEILELKQYETEFPIYAKILSCQFEKGRFRRELLNQGMKQCHLLAGVFKDLPLNLKEDVLSLMSMRELEVAVYACKGISDRQ